MFGFGSTPQRQVEEMVNFTKNNEKTYSAGLTLAAFCPFIWCYGLQNKLILVLLAGFNYK